MHVVLVAPEIAPNTGNVIRLCANAGATLHLVEPLGFALDDRALRRAGLDYRELADVRVHASWTECKVALPARRYACTAAGARRYDRVAFAADDAVVFGAERSGLDPAVLADFAGSDRLAIPMREGNRSLNLANAVAVVVYEAWRQRGFTGAGPGGSMSETPARR